MSTELMQPKIQQFMQLLFDGIDAWTKAGDLLVQMIDEDPKVIEKICEQNPGISKGILYRFEAIGRRELFPKLLASSSYGVKCLMRMPYSLQKKHYDEPVPVLTNNNDLLLVDLHNLTPEQCKQVFANNHIRDQAEQRAYLESEKTKRNPVRSAEELPYYIQKNKVIIRKDTILGKRDLTNIVKMLK